MSIINNKMDHHSILNALLNELQPINFHERAGLNDGEALERKHYLIVTIEEILKTAEEKKWSLCMSDENLYCYNVSNPYFLDSLGV